MASNDASYGKRLSDVLKLRDVATLRAFLIEEAKMRDPERIMEIDSISDEDLEKRMYKMIIARPDLGDMHADARRWLRDNGEDEHFG